MQMKNGANTDKKFKDTFLSKVNAVGLDNT